VLEQGNGRQVIPRHISALDGLRAFAIIAVILHHCGEYYLLQDSAPSSPLRAFVENLGSGVDLFFALSGFLITGILLDSMRRPHFFTRFYWRRGLRIWPLYYTFLFTIFLVHRRAFSGLGVMPFALYYRNFLGPDRASDIYIGQFWSLCVEEQFYLVWPLVIYIVPRFLRMPLIVFLIFFALCLRIYFSRHGLDTYVIYRLPFCHMDVLLAGAAIAVLTRQGVGERMLSRICWAMTTLGAVGLFVIESARPTGLSAVIQSFELTSTSLLFGGIVGHCVRCRGRITAAILGSRFLGSISTRSYAMYVFHLVPLYASAVLLARLKITPIGCLPAILLILGIGSITYGMAWLSWRYLEEPFLRLKKWEWFVKSPRPKSGHTDQSD
jgi:peptidoglycan/LPS O-acetylase OafA/YrhL